MSGELGLEFGTAIRDFQRARQQAGLEELLSRWTGKSQELLSYDDVKRKLQTSNTMLDRGLHEIPLTDIVGSVGRYRDFSRSFLPLKDSDAERWAKVKVAQTTKGLPPIDVYKVGDAYFVIDGNHRVSVAKQLGVPTIEAYVTEIPAKVGLSPNDEPRDLILKTEYSDFLRQTQLDENRPKCNLYVTVAGKYRELLDHINVHRHYMGNKEKREIPYAEAAADWYDIVYAPLAQVIRETGLLHNFPGRSTADLYLWLSNHRAEIEAHVGWEVRPTVAASDLAEKFANEKQGNGLVGRMLKSVTQIGGTTAVAQWRRDRLANEPNQKLLSSILVPITGQEITWSALEQALTVAHQENSQIYGLFALLKEGQKESLITKALETEFKKRCQEAGVNCRFVAEVGKMEQLIYRRARWVDLIVLSPFSASVTSEPEILAGYRQLIKRPPGPILLVPKTWSPMDKMLLAYDDSAMSQGALFAAAYVTKQWGIPLTVLGVAGLTISETAVLEKARTYLESQLVTADYIGISKSKTVAIATAVQETNSNLVVLGGEEQPAVLDIVTNSTIVDLIQSADVPLLVCG